MADLYDIIVVGGGMGGSAAALRAVQYNLNTCWFYGDKKTSNASRSRWIFNIDNMIGFHDGVVKDEIMKLFPKPEDDEVRQKIADAHIHISGKGILKNTRERIESDNSDHIEIIDRAATDAKFEDGYFVVSDGTREVKSRYLVVATGVMDTQPHILKERGDDVVDSTTWIYPYANRETVLYCIRCEGHLTRDENVAVIGSGITAKWISFMLHERYGVNVFILTNGEELSSDEETDKLIELYNIKVYTERITDAVGEKGGQLRKFLLADGTEIEVKFGLIAMGLHRVYNDLIVQLGGELMDEGEPTEQRHVRVNKQSETSIANLFVVGDMAKRDNEIVMKQIYTAQEYAVRAVDTIDSRTRTKRRNELLNK